jgi:endonuclease/exonuclease/phosphatase (EEP) superfamily protein YafD
VVVLGDFNCPPGTPLHEALLRLGFANAMEAAGGGVEPTHDTTGRLNYPVDHIYVSPALIPALVSAQAIRYPGFYHHGPLAPGRWLHSDHVPLVAEFGSGRVGIGRSVDRELVDW